MISTMWNPREDTLSAIFFNFLPIDFALKKKNVRNSKVGYPLKLVFWCQVSQNLFPKEMKKYTLCINILCKSCFKGFKWCNIWVQKITTVKKKTSLNIEATWIFSGMPTIYITKKKTGKKVNCLKPSTTKNKELLKSKKKNKIKQMVVII